MFKPSGLNGTHRRPGAACSGVGGGSFHPPLMRTCRRLTPGAAGGRFLEGVQRWAWHLGHESKMALVPGALRSGGLQLQPPHRDAWPGGGKLQAARTFNTKDLITDWEEIPGIDEVIERAKGYLTGGTPLNRR